MSRREKKEHTNGEKEEENREEKEDDTSRGALGRDHLSRGQETRYRTSMGISNRFQGGPTVGGTVFQERSGIDQYARAQIPQTPLLPPFPLPIFDGKTPWTFTVFLETCEGIISSMQLTDLHRLHYLKTCLRGEALESIESILPREGCYEVALERLKNEYKGGAVMMASQLRQKLNSIKRPQQDCDAKTALKAIRELLTITAQLRTTEEDHPVLTDMIVERLPERYIKKAASIRIDTPYIDTLSLIEKIETVALKDVSVEKITFSSKKNVKRDQVRTTMEVNNGNESFGEWNIEEEETSYPSMNTNGMTTLPPAKKNDSITAKGMCAFCGKHAAGQEERCRLFASPDERSSRCRLLRLCFRCLQGGASHNLLFAEMNMNLRQFLTSNAETNEKIPAADRAGGETGAIKVLGIQWETATDTIKLTVNYNGVVTTKRGYVSRIAKIFDPNGWLSPLTLPLKLVMQQLCTGSMKNDWSRYLNAEEGRDANLKLQKANGFEFSMPRYTGSSQEDDVNGNLVVFCDASDKVYAAVVYLAHRNGQKGQIIIAKSRLLPLTKEGSRKALTTPQGELRAVVLGLNLLLTALKALVNYGSCDGVQRLICLTDSTITYHRLAMRRSESLGKMSVFVRNRLLEINQIEDAILSVPAMKGRPLQRCENEKRTIEFAHVPTDKNPAHLATRGVDAAELADQERGPGQLWWDGTNSDEGLLDTIKAFPTPDDAGTDDKTTRILLGSVNPEYFRKKPDYVDLTMLNIPAIDEQDPLYMSLEEIEEANDYDCLIRTIISKVRAEAAKESTISSLMPTDRSFIQSEGHLSVEEINYGEMLLIRQHQHRFREKWSTIEKHMPGTNKQGLMISRAGRIINADLPEEAKFPILLFPEDPLIPHLVMKFHFEVMHCGVPHTLCKLCSRFWIVRGYQTVKRILKKCSNCVRYNAHSFGRPPHGEVPEGRLMILPPFRHTGLDYFGPVAFRNEGGKEDKAYVLLFTCATSRAVHLELVKTMGVVDFERAFERFINRRGCPKVIWSENAPTFKLAGKLYKRQTEFLELSNDEKGEVGSHLAWWLIKWYHSGPNQPWYGGFWERLVGIVKRCLYKTMGRAILPWDEIATLLIHVEATVNSGPLTAVPHDLKDYLEAPVMRPIDFLMPGMRCGMADDDDTEEEWIIDGIPKEMTPSARAAIKAMRLRKKSQMRFWKLWNEYYLTSLRSHHLERKNNKRRSLETPEIGKFVLISKNAEKYGA